MLVGSVHLWIGETGTTVMVLVHLGFGLHSPSPILRRGNFFHYISFCIEMGSKNKIVSHLKIFSLTTFGSATCTVQMLISGSEAMVGEIDGLRPRVRRLAPLYSCRVRDIESLHS